MQVPEESGQQEETGEHRHALATQRPDPRTDGCNQRAGADHECHVRGVRPDHIPEGNVDLTAAGGEHGDQ